MTLVLCLLLLTISCHSLPGGSLNIAYPDRPEVPALFFDNEGDHCLNNEELTALGKYYIDSKAYYKETEALLDAVNGK